MSSEAPEEDAAEDAPAYAHPVVPPALPRARAAASPAPCFAPNFELEDHRGVLHDKAGLLGRVWLAWFPSSGEDPSTKALVAVHRRFAGRPEREQARFVGFGVPGGEEGPRRLAAFAASLGASADTFLCLGASESRLAWLREEGFGLLGRPGCTGSDDTGAGGPVFVLVDRRGHVREILAARAPGAAERAAAALEALVAEPEPMRLGSPAEIFERPAWIEARRKQQAAAAKTWPVYHAFSFSDRRRASGITFENRVVDDAGRYFKAVHYDHGNGVSVADVDGDGRQDVFFCNQVGSNQLWRNLGDGTFANITGDSGIAMKDVISVAAAFADSDNDGDPDLFVTSVRGGNRFFVNDGKGRFEDRTAAAGLGYVGHSSGSVFFDYDQDGLLDLYVCNVGTYTTEDVRDVVNDTTTAGSEPGTYSYYEGMLDGFVGHLHADRNEAGLLYRNLGGNRFENVTHAAGLYSFEWSGDATPIDGNDDRRPDLYILNMQGHDAYYENVDGKSFVRKRHEVFPRTPWGSMGVKVFDADCDGDFDLFLSDMHSDMSEQQAPEDEKRKSNMVWPESILRSGGKSIYGNAFFRKSGPDAFEEISDRNGTETYWPWGLSVGDLNGDGYEDLFIASSMNYPWRYGFNSVLLNDGRGGFLDAECVLGVEPRRGRLIKPWFELDCVDGDCDNAQWTGKDGPAIVWAPVGSRSSVIFDIDGDGDLDVVTNDFNGPPLVLESDLAARRPVRYLGIRLRGTTSNRDGLGAVVRVTAGGLTQSRVHDGRSGYLSQSAMSLHFGLGDAERVDAIEVRWPSGKTQKLTRGIALDRVVTLTEP